MPDTPYRYIQSYYGLTFNVGDRIEFTEGKRKPGVVLKPSLSGEHRVHVKFDDGHTGMCHPNSLEIMPPQK